MKKNSVFSYLAYHQCEYVLKFVIGVTRQVGDALLSERTQRSGRVISLGIAPWGIVENNQELIGINRDVPYHSISSPRLVKC